MTRAGGGNAFSSRETAGILIAALVAAAVLWVLFYPSTLEDAFITFRYAGHLAEGHGLGAWNAAGERVEGYSSLLWMLLLAEGDRLGIDPRTSAKVLGLGANLLLVASLILAPAWGWRSGRNPGESGTRPEGGTPQTAGGGGPLPDSPPEGARAAPETPVLAGVFLSLYLPLAWYGASGMETTLFAALTALVLASLHVRRGAVLLAVAGSLLILLRPEGIVVAGVGAAARRRERGRAGSDGAVLAALFGGTLLALVGLRVAVFGDVVPNTYWAKAGGAGIRHLDLGFTYLYGWLRFHGVATVLFAAGFGLLLVRAWRGRFRAAGPAFVVVLVLLFGAYAVRVGGDNDSAFPLFRHGVRVAPLWALCVAAAVVRFLPRGPRTRLGAMVLAALLADATLLGAHRGFLKSEIREGLAEAPRLAHAAPDPYALWFRKLAGDSTVVASSLAGELPYLVDAVHVDLLGLNDRHIAREGTFDPRGPQDSKTDMAWVLDRRPDVLEGYVSARKILAGAPAESITANRRRRMSEKMARSPVFRTEYVFVRNGPYAYRDRAVFVRRGARLRPGAWAELDTVAVERTSLGAPGP